MVVVAGSKVIYLLMARICSTLVLIKIINLRKMLLSFVVVLLLVVYVR